MGETIPPLHHSEPNPVGAACMPHLPRMCHVPVGAAYMLPASSLLVPRPPASATSRQAAAIDEPFEMILDRVAVGAGQIRGLSHRHPPMIEDDAQ